MSPLTKLFVVLLVLVSIILTAGTVTFVNKLDPLQKNLTLAQTQLQQKDALLSQKESEYTTQLAQLTDAQKQAENNAAMIRTQMQSLRSAVEDRDAQIAKLNNNLAVLTSANSSQSARTARTTRAKSAAWLPVAGKRSRQNASAAALASNPSAVATADGAAAASTGRRLT